MGVVRLSTCFFLVGLTAFAFLIGTPAQQPDKIDPKPVNEIIQQFPTKGPMQSAWKVLWDTETGYGLYIKGAWFKKGADEPWIQVLSDARLSEMFVPYHSGSPRFWDISYNFALHNIRQEEAGPDGKLLAGGKVVMEVRDRGIAWIYDRVKRGEVLELWGSLHAANYRYIMKYGFQDDGVINFWAGSTGRNYGSREYEGHMHNALWRIDVDLDGSDHNTVQVMRHIEPDGKPGKSRTEHAIFNDGKEGGLNFKPEEFTMLQVVNTEKKNKRDKPWSYDFVNYRQGNARHFGGDKEECTVHDFWVTKMHARESFYTKVPTYVKEQESIIDTDIVVWYSAPTHHEPRSEDGEMKGSSFHGATPVSWSRFDMRPRDFWDRSPLFP